MASSGTALAISFGIYGAIFTALLLLFSLLRILRITRAFYAPRERCNLLRDPGKPPPSVLLGRSFFKWLPNVIAATESQLLHYAGIDATVYIKFLRLGVELFTLISILVLCTALPINLTQGYIDTLLPASSASGSSSSSPYDPSTASPYMFWLYPPYTNLTSASNTTGSSNSKPQTIKPPKIYNDSVPDPPPGILWWQYLPNIPELPNITEALGPDYVRYDWRYDPDYSTQKYVFSNLDKSTLANVPPASPWLYAHAVLAWIVTFLAFWRIWKMCALALRLRQYHLLTIGAESHSVLVTDVPGIAHGTIADRLSSTALKWLPKSVQKRALEQIEVLKKAPSSVIKRRRKLPVPSSPQAVEAISGSRWATRDLVTPFGSRASTKLASRPSGGVGEVAPSSSDEEEQASSSSGGIHRQVMAERRRSFEAAAEPQVSVDPIRTVPRYQVEDVVADESWKESLGIDRWSEAAGLLQSGASVSGMVEQQFRSIYGEDVAAVHVVHATPALDALVGAYDRVKSAASDSVDKMLTQYQAGKRIKPERKLIVGPRLGPWGRQRYGVKPTAVDAFEFYRDRLEQLRASTGEAQEAAMSAALPAAFVTFKSRKSQVVAAGALMSEDLQTWRCKAAPRPDEVVWHNLGLRQWERSLRFILLWITFFLLVAFFMVPVAAVQALLSTNSLVEFVQNIPILNSLITSILPSLALVIFLACLPPLLRLMRTIGGAVSLSEIDRGVVSWFFIFQVITAFFGSFVAGTFANQFQQLISDPKSIVTILGTAAPQAATFFMSFLLTQALISNSVSLLRLWGLFMFLIKYKFASTPRSKQRMIQAAAEEQRYGTLIPADTIAALLGFTFCLISPIIVPLTVLYFATSFLVQKYNAMVVAREGFQSGGMLWIQTFKQLVTGLIIFQAVMISLLGIKKAPVPSLLVLPLPFITILYALAAQATFWKPMQTLSLLTAVAKDAEEESESGGAGSIVAASNAYLSPSFKIDDDEHQELIHQCEVLRQAQADGDYSRVLEFMNKSESSSSLHASQREAGDLEV